MNLHIEALREAICSRMDQLREREGIAGLSLALTDQDGTVLTASSGWADRAARIPMTERSLVGIASVSKVFTAAAVMRLEEEGKLDIMRPVCHYIPEFSVKSRFPGSPPIRVMDLMTHHSGLPRDWLNHFYSYDPEPFQLIVERLREEYVCRPPGCFYSYSNLAVALLGAVAERASGETFEALMERAVIRPAGLEHTSLRRRYEQCGLYAQAYQGQEMRAEIPPRDLPGGGVWSCAADLARFLRMHLAGGEAWLSQATVERMFTPQTGEAELDFGRPMGLLWQLERPALAYAGRTASHGGALLYYRTDVCLLPDHGLGAAAVSNSSAAGAAVSELAEFALQQALRMQAGLEPCAPQPRPFSLRAPLTTCEPQGHYACSVGHVQVRLRKDGLCCKWNGRWQKMTGRDDGSHWLEGPGVSLRFCRHPRFQGAIMLVNGWPDGEGFEPCGVEPLWAGRQGIYRACNRMPEESLTDIAHSIRLLVRGGILLAEFIGPTYSYRRPLRVINGREAVRLGWGQGENETIHALESGELFYMGICFRPD